MQKEIKPKGLSSFQTWAVILLMLVLVVASIFFMVKYFEELETIKSNACEQCESYGYICNPPTSQWQVENLPKINFSDVLK